MSEIKGILLDLDNTLYDYNICNDHAKTELFKIIGDDFAIDIAIIRKVYDDARSIVKRRLGSTASSHSRLLYIQKALEILGIKNYIPKAIYYNNIFWQKFFERMKLFDGVIDFLEYAKTNKIRICVVTDMVAEIQMKKIVQLGIENYIDFIVSSEEVGSDKPSAPIFLLALKKMGVPNEDVVVIGDDSKDTTGAQAAGLRVIKTNPYIFKQCKLIEFIKNI